MINGGKGKLTEIWFKATKAVIRKVDLDSKRFWQLEQWLENHDTYVSHLDSENKMFGCSMSCPSLERLYFLYSLSHLIYSHNC